MEFRFNPSLTMDYNNKNPLFLLTNLTLLFLLIVGVFSLSFFSSFSPKFLITSHRHSSLHYQSHPPQTVLRTPRDELEELLKKTAMKNKTVIIAVVNKAYVEGEVKPNMLDLFLEGFWAGEGTRELVNHLMVVAVDQTAYDRCVFRGLHCYRLVTDGVDFMGEKVFMSDDFIKMMWRRTLFLLDILKKGYNFIFTDADVIWLRNPMRILTTTSTQHFDIQFSTDIYDGNSTSTHNPINTGFYFVKSNNKTIALFEKWYGLKDNTTGMKEQDVLQNLIWQGALADLGIKARFLDTRFFSGFCQVSRDIRSVVTVHANCCRFISAKVGDLNRVLSDWAQFKMISTNASKAISHNGSERKKKVRWSPHVNCIRSWQVNVESGNKT